MLGLTPSIRAVVAVLPGDLRRQQARERVDRAGIRDHAARSISVPSAMRTPHARPSLNQHLLDARVGEHLAARRADARQDRVGDAPRAADRVEAAVQVVLRDQRLDHERRALRRQPQVAPLAGQHRDQFRVVGQLRQHLPGRAVEARRQPAAEQRAGDGGRPGRQRAVERERAHAARDLAQQLAGSGRSPAPRAGSAPRGCRGTPRGRPRRRRRGRR